MRGRTRSRKRSPADLRLSLPGEDRERATTPMIRELKVLGPELPVGFAATASSVYQHRGLGRALVGRAEERARTLGYDEIRVISAIGTRPYYRALGFVRQGPYMAKGL